VLVPFGEISDSDLALNLRGRYQTTTQYLLKLKKGQYISSVLYQGGLSSSNHPSSSLPRCPSPNTLITDATDSNCTAGEPAVGGGDFPCEVTCVGGEWEYEGPTSGSVGAGTFCMYYYNEPIEPDIIGTYTAFGCEDTASQAGLPETMAFTPNPPIPPGTPEPTYVIGAAGPRWQIETTTGVWGTLSVWLCLQTVPGLGP
jgi:hypothetical protein